MSLRPAAAPLCVPRFGGQLLGGWSLELGEPLKGPAKKGPSSSSGLFWGWGCRQRARQGPRVAQHEGGGRGLEPRSVSPAYLLFPLHDPPGAQGGSGEHRMPGWVSTWGRVPPCHQPRLLCPPRSTPTRDTASAAPSPASTMKSRCCTFYRSTSEPRALGPAHSEHKWLRRRRRRPRRGSRREGPRGPRRPLRSAPPPAAPAGQPRPGASAFAAPAPFIIVLMLLAVLPAASRWPGRRDEARAPEARPQAIPSSPRCPGAPTPPGTGRGVWRGAKTLGGPGLRRGASPRGPRPRPAARRPPPKHATALPSSPAHFMSRSVVGGALLTTI